MESYTYTTIGNLTSKPGMGAYTYTATGGGCAAGTPATKPHAAAQAGSTSSVYDGNGNLTSGAGGIVTWDREQRPASTAAPLSHMSPLSTIPSAVAPPSAPQRSAPWAHSVAATQSPRRRCTTASSDWTALGHQHRCTAA